MSLKWYYKNRTCEISMPGYVANVLSKFQHDTPEQPQHTPSRYVTPFYGSKTQYATQDETPPLAAKKCLNMEKASLPASKYMKFYRAILPSKAAISIAARKVELSAANIIPFETFSTASG
jgi:hypothetical protein